MARTEKSEIGGDNNQINGWSKEATGRRAFEHEDESMSLADNRGINIPGR